MKGLERLAFVVWLAVTLTVPRPAVGGSDDPVTLDGLLEFMEAGSYADAEADARTLLVDLERRHGPDSVEVAEVLDILLESRWRGGKATDPETKAIGERALAIKRAQLGDDDAGVGKTMHHLAIVAYFGGDYAHARELWLEAIAVRETALGSSHPDVAESLNALANLLQRTGELLEARQFYDRALEIRTAAFGDRDPRVGQTLNNLAALLTMTGDYQDALPLAEWSLAIREEALGPDHPQVANALINLGDLEDQLGSSERAVEHFKRAAKIIEEKLGPDHRELGICLNNLAEQDRRAGRYQTAIPVFERALRIWETAYSPEHPQVAIVLNNLSLTHQALGDVELALELQERAIAIREAGLGADHPRLAVSQQNLADLLTALGDDARAGELYGNALAIRLDKFGPQHPAVARSRIGLATVLARTGATAEAFTQAIEAERVARDHLRLTSRTLSEQQALRYSTALDGGLDLAVTLAAKGAAGADVGEVQDALIRSRAVVLDEMAARQRSVSSSTDPEIRRLSDALTTTRTRLANLTVRGVGSMKPEVYRRLIDETRTEKERLERALGSASVEFATAQQRSRLGAAEVLEHLPDDSALVSFLAYRHVAAVPGPPAPGTDAKPRDLTPVLSYAAIAARSDGTAAVVSLDGLEAIDALVAGWKREAAQGLLLAGRDAAEAEAAYRRVGHELRRRVWDPLERWLKGAERVFVVPDGSLNLISFVAFPTSKDRYLIETGPLVHYLSAERDLVPRPGPAADGRGLLAIGGADYDGTATFAALGAPSSADDTGKPGPDTGSTTRASTSRAAPCASFAALRFSPLPGAVREGSEIAALWEASLGEEFAAVDGVILLSGEAATERTFKQQAQGRRVIHVATHGFFLGAECSSSAGSRGVQLVPKSKDAARPTTAPASPLLMSGVAFAGANHRAHAAHDEEDGILTAEEIAAVDLSNVEWAVLSGCDTGVGSIQAGEGVFGLRRAMQVAGVRTLIMSLWPVDDQATREWMSALYAGRLERNLDTSRAVQAASRDLLDRRRQAKTGTHPYFWAAFVAAGDWR